MKTEDTQVLKDARSRIMRKCIAHLEKELAAADSFYIHADVALVLIAVAVRLEKDIHGEEGIKFSLITNAPDNLRLILQQALDEFHPDTEPGRVVEEVQ